MNDAVKTESHPAGAPMQDESSTEAMSRARETYEQASQLIVRTVQQRPGASLAAAAVIGVAMGWLWKRK